MRILSVYALKIKLLNEEKNQSFEQLMIAKYPEYQLNSFIKAGIEAVAQELIVENVKF